MRSDIRELLNLLDSLHEWYLLSADEAAAKAREVLQSQGYTDHYIKIVIEAYWPQLFPQF